MRFLTTLLLCLFVVSTHAEAKVVAHPKGCSRKLFCGCGASVFLFGKPRRELFAARSWFRFPKAEPAPYRVAVQRHHVFVILKTLGNGKVLAYDANSGGGKTQIHVRSLRGYSVRDAGVGIRLAMAF